jgi:5-methyltetrahydropteroyltriglutamate--homocysteine methyltransferase
MDRYQDHHLSMSPSSSTRLTSSNLGYPRIGPGRDLKWMLEAYWAGKTGKDELESRARALRATRWQDQRAAGIDQVPSNDFSLYDHVLDLSLTMGAIPDRFEPLRDGGSLDLMFAMARGTSVEGQEIAALEMTKWFDTNYHYLVPELGPGQQFSLDSLKPVEEFQEALALGVETRPVLLGPVSYLRLAKTTQPGWSPLSLLDRLLPAYADLLVRLAAAGAHWVQMDEPFLAQDAPVELLEAVEDAYSYLRRRVPGLKLLVASYFAGLGANLQAALMLPVDALHLDLVRGAPDLEPALELAPDAIALSLGVVDGRNVWTLDPDPALRMIELAVSKLGPDRVLVAPSCSLIHVPVSVRQEDKLSPEVLSWLSFAQEKLGEVAALAGSKGDGSSRAEVLDGLRQIAKGRRESPLRHDPEVQQRLAAVSPQDLRRSGDSAQRRQQARSDLGLPLLPTTTIGSFPQRSELRQARARLRRQEIGQEEYDQVMREEVRRVIAFQEEAGLDVLVHGEPERNDMVEYFAERLRGIATSQGGWVQSYGSRCTKPPVIFGDVSRPEPMTVAWSAFAQSLTQRPVKGILTGPVTILQWSFPREDVPRSQTCVEIALTLRDEVQDLERAGIRIIQIDEPALREAMPLRRADQPSYWRWAIDGFRLAAAGASEAVQIHTHMCYSEFGDIIESIAELDADALYIEAARSGMELLTSFAAIGYPSEVGPGLYDIHSPVVPTADEMAERLRAAALVIPPERLWANPDCGLKTRRWSEVEPSLRHLVAAARQVAAELAAAPVASG